MLDLLYDIGMWAIAIFGLFMAGSVLFTIFVVFPFAIVKELWDNHKLKRRKKDDK